MFDVWALCCSLGIRPELLEVMSNVVSLLEHAHANSTAGKWFALCGASPAKRPTERHANLSCLRNGKTRTRTHFALDGIRVCAQDLGPERTVVAKGYMPELLLAFALARGRITQLRDKVMPGYASKRVFRSWHATEASPLRKQVPDKVLFSFRIQPSDDLGRYACVLRSKGEWKLVSSLPS